MRFQFFFGFVSISTNNQGIQSQYCCCCDYNLNSNDSSTRQCTERNSLQMCLGAGCYTVTLETTFCYYCLDSTGIVDATTTIVESTRTKFWVPMDDEVCRVVPFSRIRNCLPILSYEDLSLHSVVPCQETYMTYACPQEYRSRLNDTTCWILHHTDNANIVPFGLSHESFSREEHTHTHPNPFSFRSLHTFSLS